MQQLLSSNIMPRTTLDIDATVLRELKRRRQREGRSIGVIASELLARELSREPNDKDGRFEWKARPMRARVELDDKDAVYTALEGSERRA
jgi:hypothetical protein